MLLALPFPVWCAHEIGGGGGGEEMGEVGRLDEVEEGPVNTSGSEGPSASRNDSL